MNCSVFSKCVFEIFLIVVMLVSMCCSSMRLPFSSALRGYLNLNLSFCAADRVCAAEPQLKKSGAAVSKKSKKLGGTVYNNNA